MDLDVDVAWRVFVFFTARGWGSWSGFRFPVGGFVVVGSFVVDGIFDDDDIVVDVVVGVVVGVAVVRKEFPAR